MEAEIVSMCLNLFNGPNGAGTSKLYHLSTESCADRKLHLAVLNQS